MGALNKPFGYNDFARPNGHSYVRAPTVFLNAATQTALDELEFVSSWAEFMKICETQKAKRGY